MANALFLYDNALQGSMSYFGGGSSVQNMAYAPLAQRWVSPGLSAPNCTVTFSVPGNPTVAAFVLAHHNLTLAAQVRIQADNAGTFAAPVYDSGWLNAFATGIGVMEQQTHRFAGAFERGMDAVIAKQREAMANPFAGNFDRGMADMDRRRREVDAD